MPMTNRFGTARPRYARVSRVGEREARRPVAIFQARRGCHSRVYQFVAPNPLNVQWFLHSSVFRSMKMETNRKVALVTNAADYAGPPAVTALSEAGFQVLVHDDTFDD